MNGVIEMINGNCIKQEKGFLEEISSLHKHYQEQIEQLRGINSVLEANYNKER